MSTTVSHKGTAGQSAPAVFYLTLGCAKNEVDTDRMRALLARAGYDETDNLEEADVVLINTCSFLASATQESIECTLALAEDKAAGVRRLPLIMCGCVPSRYGDELARELPEVAAFVRTDEEDEIVSVVDRVLNRHHGDIDTHTPIKRWQHNALRTVEGTSAYLKISDGCNRFCSFCAIPYIRGRYASRPRGEIMREARALVEGGVREIVLIGQDTGVWGTDLAEADTLPSLLRDLATVVRPYQGWLRVLYLQPDGITDELISVIGEVDEVLPYLDIPFQHCSARILKRMRRAGSFEAYSALLARLRREIPDVVLRTTGMTGFPGETEEEADELVDFIKEGGFSYCSVFSYSAEEGTLAATLEEQIPDAIKLERTQRLLDAAESVGFAATAAHVGETVNVIIDGIERDDETAELIGHAWFQAPDCDGAVHIEVGDARVGDIVVAKLTDAFCYELVGEIVGDGPVGEMVGD